MRRVSGPLLDRIDMRVVMPRLAADELVAAADPESSQVVAPRIAAAWDLARDRNGGEPNARLAGRQLDRVCALDEQATRTLKEISASLDLTARGIHRVMRVARTVADLAGAGHVEREHILAASSLRDRSLELAAAA